ncbi:MAG: DUF3089 domain-containing protein [Burkholderiales bacterium]|nr:DUF3089 domain-containing protein [Burkholderiales bacterium]
MNRGAEAIIALAALAVLAGCGDSKPQAVVMAPAPVDTSEAAPAVDPVAPMDYAQAGSWLCRPDSQDACEQVAAATRVAADGRLTKETFTPASDPPIDCFYVYPTVSRDPAGNSDTAAGPEEIEITRQQAARFGAVCKVYAPVYRQVTVASLRKMLAGEDSGSNREIAYADVKAAWERYLASDNQGRGVVLIGHDQGAGLLTRLIAAEIDGKPAQEKLVSAVLPGAGVEISSSGSVGGSFRNVPLCRSADSTRCVTAWSAFRAGQAPPGDSLFGKAQTEGLKVACANPAELDGSGGVLKPMLPVTPVLFDEIAQPAPWTVDGAVIETPFVTLPEMLSAQCVDRGGFSYLEVKVNADPADARTDTINGDVVIGGTVQPQWGLHLIDMHLAMGNLVEIVRRQGEAWRQGQANAAVLPPEFHKPQ